MQSSARMCVERTFGILKMRFRILQGLHYRDIETIKHIIFAACVLHNICTRARLEMEPEEEAEVDELMRKENTAVITPADNSSKKNVTVGQQQIALCKKIFGH